MKHINVAPLQFLFPYNLHKMKTNEYSANVPYCKSQHQGFKNGRGGGVIIFGAGE